jgi:hypothetical protein
MACPTGSVLSSDATTATCATSPCTTSDFQDALSVCCESDVPKNSITDIVSGTTALSTGGSTGEITFECDDCVGEGINRKVGFVLASAECTAANIGNLNSVIIPSQKKIASLDFPHEGTYDLCYSTDAGITWSRQTSTSTQITVSGSATAITQLSITDQEAVTGALKHRHSS